MVNNELFYAIRILRLIGYVFYYAVRKIFPKFCLKKKTLSNIHGQSSSSIGSKKTMELISINSDGSATIKTLYSSETLTAKPSEYFIGKDFGSFGLRLLAVSHDKQEILLKHTVPEDLG